MSIPSIVQPINARVLMSAIAVIVLLGAVLFSFSHSISSTASSAGDASESCQSRADVLRAADRSRNGVSLTCDASHLTGSGAAQ